MVAEAEGVDAAAETTEVSGADGAAPASSDDGATTRLDAGGKPDGADHPGQTEQASADGGSETEQGSDEVDPAQQVAELQDELLRRQAAFENFRKRASEDARAAEQRGRASLLERLLPSIDNLERALLARGVAPGAHSRPNAAPPATSQFPSF